MPSLRLLSAALVVLASTCVPARAQSAEQPAAPPTAEAQPDGAPPAATAPQSRMPGIYVTPVPPLRTPPAEGSASEPQGGCQYMPRKLDLLV